MFKHKLIYFLLILCSPLFAQEKINQTDEQGRRHGPWKVNFEGTNEVKFEGNFLHGKETGKFKFYKKGFQEHPTAIMEFQDAETAQATYYTQDGKPISQGMMKNKQRKGTWVYFHNKSEDTMMTENYSEGKLNGLQITYFPDGITAEKTEYKHGRKHGKSLIYGRNGQVLQHLNYKNGELHGPASYYNAVGEKLIEGQYYEDRKTGNWRYFNDGNLEKEKDH
ncbi:MAG TPA: aspartic peptidase [Salegentibacter sp.]|uniref:toxin-antitoxin system YwqK family antitoxin n=1 Tax=Salegentibacter sp. TaxID=1903072 RepID=UPI002F94888B